MPSRPKGKPPLWATTETFTDAGQPWDAADLAVRPADGEIALGLYKPNQPIASDFANFRDRDNARRLQNLDLLEVLNWPEPSSDAGLDTTGGGGVKSATCALWSPAAPIYVVPETDDTLRVSSDGGYTWADDYSDAGCVLREIVSSSLSTLVLRTIGGAGKIAREALGVSWQSQTPTGAISLLAAVADETLGVYWIVGQGPGSKAWIWRVEDEALPATEDATTYGTALAGSFEFVASSPGSYKLAGDANNLYRWLDSAAPAAVTPGDTAMVDCVWLPEDELFMTVHEGGTSFVYVSATGATGTWTRRDMPTGVAVRSGVMRPGAVRGSIYVVPVEGSGSTPFLAVTGDAGLTWTLLPEPLRRHTQSGGRPYSDVVRSFGHRFAAFGYKAAGVIAHALGLRTGG